MERARGAGVGDRVEIEVMDYRDVSGEPFDAVASIGMVEQWYIQMPDLVDYSASIGYMKGPLMVPVSFSQQITLGGGDIRRQDMPFVSNKMNLSRVDALVKYALPWVKGLQVQLAAAYIVSGRNVGQGTTLSAGFLYTIGF